MSLLLNSGLGFGGTISAGGGDPDPDPGSTLLARTMSPFTAFGNGRFDFYFDEFERSDVGAMHFCVTRLFGTSGAVTVDYDIYDEDGTTSVANGTLSWADGNADIKIISYTPSSKSSGDYRIHAALSNATGGATLHHGAQTKAYGVIDDGTIAADSDAVFYDSAAGGGGNGSQLTPYNNIYTAISNIGSKKYLYGKGTTTPDGTNTNQPYGTGSKSIHVPATRTGEDDRLYIRNWPGFTWTIDGTSAGSDIFGFIGKSNESYHTYRGINFLNLGNSAVNDGGGIWYHYGTSEAINVELCDFNGMDGKTGTNTGGVNLYGVDGGKIWRCTFANITINGGTNANTAGVYSYTGTNISIQRCEFESTMENGIYQKRLLSGDVTMNARFTIFRGCRAYYGISGGGDVGHFGMVFSNNYCSGTKGDIHHTIDGAAIATGQNEVADNYFYQSGASDQGAISGRGYADWQVYGNIFDSCPRCWTDNATNTDDTPGYFDYNVAYNNSSAFASINYVNKTAAAFNTEYAGAIPYCQNQQTGNPNATDAANEDVTLGGSSSATGANICANDCGVYLTGDEKLGATGLVVLT